MRRTTWFLLVGLLAITGCHKKAPVVTNFQPQFSATLASGSTGDTMSKYAQQYGVPIYPQAAPDTSHFSPGTSDTRIFLTYTTADSPDKVAQYYMGALNMRQISSGKTTELQGITPTGATVTVTIGQDAEAQTTFSINAVRPQGTSYAQPTPAGTTMPVATPPPPTPQPQQPDQVATTQDTSQQNGQSWSMDTSKPLDNGGGSGDSQASDQATGGNDNSGQSDNNQSSGDNNNDGNQQPQQDNGPPGGG